MILQPQWRMKESLSLTDYHHTLYRDDDAGIQCERITRVKFNGDFGKAQTSYYIDDDPREFLSEDELIEAYNEKFKREGEDPEHEVLHFSIRRKRQPKPL